MATAGRGGAISLTVGAGDSGTGGMLLMTAGQTSAAGATGGSACINGGSSSPRRRAGSAELRRLCVADQARSRTGGLVLIRGGEGQATSGAAVLIFSANSGSTGTTGRLVRAARAASSGTSKMGNSGALRFGSGTATGAFSGGTASAAVAVGGGHESGIGGQLHFKSGRARLRVGGLVFGQWRGYADEHVGRDSNRGWPRRLERPFSQNGTATWGTGL